MSVGHFLEVVAPDRLSLTLDDPDGRGSGSFEVVTVVLKDLGNGKTEMTFTKRGGSMPAEKYLRTMRGWLIFFERLAGHVGESLKARHDTQS